MWQACAQRERAEEVVGDARKGEGEGEGVGRSSLLIQIGEEKSRKIRDAMRCDPPAACRLEATLRHAPPAALLKLPS